MTQPATLPGLRGRVDRSQCVNPGGPRATARNAPTEDWGVVNDGQGVDGVVWGSRRKYAGVEDR